MTANRKPKDPKSGLGRTQRLVLHLLASDDKTARHLAYDWPGLSEESARGALLSLGRRGLVDAVRFDRHSGSTAREYGLTVEGRQVEAALFDDGCATCAACGDTEGVRFVADGLAHFCRACDPTTEDTDA